jgi:hypothetical protein
METPFFMPRQRPDKEAAAVLRLCWEPAVHYFFKLGP